jgi:hypothetical protein
VRLAVAVAAVFAPVDGRCADSSASPPATRTALWGYEFVEVFARPGIASLSHREPGERIDLTLVRDVTPDVAAVYIDDEITLFESLFTLKRTGYPGQTTRYIECPPELRPRYAEAVMQDGTFRYFRAFASANFVAGISAPDLAAYRLVKGYLYCPALATIFEIEHFSPLEGSDLGDAFLERVSCPAAVP